MVSTNFDARNGNVASCQGMQFVVAMGCCLVFERLFPEEKVMTEPALHAIAVPPASGRPPKAAVILLHGWGANARDLHGLVPALDLPDYFFLCAEAPLDLPQVPGGKMWYDLQVADYPGLEESRQRLRAWLPVVEAQTGVSLERTVLAGFSQGGAMALDVGVDFSLAGLMSLSGYLHAPVRSSQSPCRSPRHPRSDRACRSRPPNLQSILRLTSCRALLRISPNGTRDCARSFSNHTQIYRRCNKIATESVTKIFYYNGRVRD